MRRNSTRRQWFKASIAAAGPILGKGARCIDDAGASTIIAPQSDLDVQLPAQSWQWSNGNGTLRVFDKCMDVTGGGIANETQIQLWDCNGTAPSNGAGGNRAAS